MDKGYTIIAPAPKCLDSTSLIQREIAEPIFERLPDENGFMCYKVSFKPLTNEEIFKNEK